MSTSWWLDALKNNRENYPKNVFEERKRIPRQALIGLWAFEQLCPVIAPVKQSVLFTRPMHSGQYLLRLQTLDTEAYNIFSKPSYNDTQFK